MTRMEETIPSPGTYRDLLGRNVEKRPERGQRSEGQGRLGGLASSEPHVQSKKTENPWKAPLKRGGESAETLLEDVYFQYRTPASFGKNGEKKKKREGNAKFESGEEVSGHTGRGYQFRRDQTSGEGEKSIGNKMGRGGRGRVAYDHCKKLFELRMKRAREIQTAVNSRNA